MITNFSILDHLDRLNIVKETPRDYHCTCPVCGDGGFKIEKGSGKYTTFKCGCMDTPAGKKAVINALAPRDKNQKAPRPKQIRTWVYSDRSGAPLVRVGREDSEKIFPSINIRKSRRRSPKSKPSSSLKENQPPMPSGKRDFPPPPTLAALVSGSRRTQPI